MTDNTPFPAAEFRRQIATLAEALRDGLLCPVVGAGLSQNADLPSWDDLATLMANELGLSEAERAAEPDPLAIADLYESRHGIHELRRLFVRELTRVSQPSQAHYALAAVAAQCPIFTTNYDPLLETALEGHLGRRPATRFIDRDYPYSPAAGEAVVYKVCGDVESPTSMVITSREFCEYPQTHPNFHGALKEALKAKTALIIGASLRDPNWQRVYSQVLSELGENARRHYAIFDALEDQLIEQYRALHLEPVCLGDYRHLVGFLRGVRAAAGREMPTDRTRPSTVFVLPPPVAVLDETLREAFEDAKRKSDRGLWSSALNDLNLLLRRLATLRDERNLGLRVSAHLLAAQLSLLAHSVPDINAAKQHIDDAQRLATGDRQPEIEVASALLKLHEGDWAGAQQSLAAAGSDQAYRLSFALRLAEEDSHGCEEVLSLTERTVEELGRNPAWRPLIARYLALCGDFARSDALVNEMLDGDPSGAAVEAAALCALLRSTFAVREFTSAHAVSEHLLLEIDLTDLVDFGARERAVELFSRAAVFYRQAGEPNGEARALAASIQLRLPMADTDLPIVLSAELISDANRLRLLRPDHITLEILATLEPVWIAGLSADPAERLRNQLDKQANPSLVCQWLRHLCPTLSEQQTESVAETLNAASGIYDTPELQCVWASAMVDLHLRAGQPARAERVLAALVVPVRYQYLASALELLLLRFQSKLPEASRLLRDLLTQFPTNPIVLAICARRGAELLPLPVREQCARDLAALLPTRFAYETLAALVAAGGKHTELLEIIEEAEVRRVALDARLAVLARARCLLSVGRIRSAYPFLLRAYEGGLCEPPDIHNLAMIEATGRNNVDVAVELEREVIRAAPDLADAYVRLAQLLVRRGHDEDLREAYRFAKLGAERFPDNASILVNYLAIGFRTGHDRDVASMVMPLHERFPDIMQQMPVEHGIEMFKELWHRAAEAERLYRTAPLPVVMFCAFGAVRTPYYRFWRVSSSARSGLETAMGTQAGLAEALIANEVLPASAVIDYTALVTLHELFADEMPSILGRAFTSIHVPESFRAIMYREGRLLSETGQPARIAAEREVLHLIESSDQLTVILPIAGEADPTGARAIRAYAVQQNIPLLDEYPQDEGDGDDVVRLELADIVDVLRVTGAPQNVQQEVTALARPKRREARPALESGMSVAADILTLVTLAQTGALRFVAEYFGSVIVAKRSVQWLASELDQDEFETTCRQQFRSLEKMIESLEQSGMLKFQPVQRQDVDDGDDGQSGTDDDAVRGAHDYVLDTLALGANLGCPLLTDDRALLVITGDGLPPHRFGTDVLLRWLFVRGEIDAAAYCDRYDRFRQWNYRALPPDPDYLAWLALMEPRGQGPVFVDALEWYRQTVHLLVPETPLHPAYREQFRRGGLHGFMDNLWLTLAALWRTGVEPSAAAGVLRHLGLDRVAPAFAGRGPEFVQLLFSRAMGLLLSRAEGEKGPRIDSDWLDQVLLSVPYDAEDIDLALVDEVRDWFDHALAEAPTRQVATLIIVELLARLPARTRGRLAESDVGPRLAQDMGIRIETHHGFVLRTPEENLEFRVAESELGEVCWRAARELLVDDADTYEEQGLVFRLGGERQAAYLVAIEVTWSEAHRRSAHGAPLGRVLNLLHWFGSSDVRERRKAWEIGRECLIAVLQGEEAAVTPLASFERLVDDIASEDETQWRRASQECQAILRGGRGFVVKMMRDAVTLGAAHAPSGLVDWTRAADAASWLGISWRDLADERSFAEHSAAVAQEIRSLAAPCDSASAAVFATKLRMRWYSLFCDAVATYQPVLDALLPMGCQDREALVSEILSMSEQSASQAVKTNAACLAVMVYDSLTDRAEAGGDLPSALAAEQIRKLLRDAMGAWDPTSAGREAEPSSRAALACAFTRAFYASWAGSDADAPALRYLASCAGQLFTDELSAFDGSVGEGLSVELERYAGERLRVHLEGPQSDDGFYRPELIPYLRYPGAFVGRQLAEHRQAVRRLMDSKTREALLGAGVLHAIWFRSTGGASALRKTWLDNAFALDSSGGIANLLGEDDAVGQTWASDQQAAYQMMRDFGADEHWTWLLTIFTEAKTDAEAAKYLTAFGLGAVAPSEDWVRRVSLLASSEASQRAMRSVPLWEQFLGIIAAALIRYREPCEASAVLEEFLFAGANSMLEHQGLLPSQAAWLAGLCSRQLYLERTAQWLEAIALDARLELAVRRRCLRRFMEVWDDLPEVAHEALGPTLAQVARNPAMYGLIELKSFVAHAPAGT